MNATCFFYIWISQKIFNFSVIDRFEQRPSTIRNIEFIGYFFNFYNAWMISVRNGNIPNWQYAGIFEIYVEAFWFSTIAFSKNSYVIIIKQLCQLFYIGNNFVFVIKCYIVISYETFICKKRLDKLPKVLLVVKLFSVSLLR